MVNNFTLDFKYILNNNIIIYFRKIIFFVDNLTIVKLIVQLSRHLNPKCRVKTDENR